MLPRLPPLVPPLLGKGPEVEEQKKLPRLLPFPPPLP
jgi:DNA-directed RNA polymerase subunit H (RpoH/RPB5)